MHLPTEIAFKINKPKIIVGNQTCAARTKFFVRAQPKTDTALRRIVTRKSKFKNKNSTHSVSDATEPILITEDHKLNTKRNSNDYNTETVRIKMLANETNAMKK